METMTSFEPKLLQRYDDRIERTINTAEENAQIITEGLKIVCDFVGKPLNDAQQLELLKGRDFEKVMDLIRSQYQFPNASDTFNLQAMGRDLEKAERAFAKASQLITHHDYTIKDGKAALTKEAIKNIEVSCTVMTQSQEQNDLLENAQRMCDLLNTSFADGLIDASHQTPIQMGIRYVKYQGGSVPFIPNITFITNRYGQY